MGPISPLLNAEFSSLSRGENVFLGSSQMCCTKVHGMLSHLRADKSAPNLTSRGVQSA